MTVLDHYFELSDYAGRDEKAFIKLINLFSEQAVLNPAGGTEVKGKEAIGRFFAEFFRKNVTLKHVWVTSPTKNGGLEAAWAVAGIRNDQTVIAFKGVDIAELDEEGKIQTLWVHIKNPSK